MFISGMGFFTDSYDLFIIGVVMAILTPMWHLSRFWRRSLPIKRTNTRTNERRYFCAVRELWRVVSGVQS
jgi:hypothetical protein